MTKSIKQAKDTIKLGIVSMVGSTAVGSIGNNPSITGPVNTALNLTNIGNVADMAWRCKLFAIWTFQPAEPPYKFVIVYNLKSLEVQREIICYTVGINYLEVSLKYCS